MIGQPLPTMLRVTLLGCSLWAGDPGSSFLGQARPGKVPVPFAPGRFNEGLATRDITWLPDGTAVYVGVFLPGFRKAVVVESHQVGGRWSPTEVAAFSRDPRWRCLEPCISPDGQRFFFVSDRPEDASAKAPGPFGIWVMDRDQGGWSVPRRLPAAVNGGGNTFYPSLTRSGELWFLREEGQGGWIMRSRWTGTGWTDAERLPAPFNEHSHQANPRVDPEGRFVLVPMMGGSDSLGGADFYAFFRAADGTWMKPVNLGAPVSSPARDEFSINLSPDGGVLFFGSDRAEPRLETGPLTWSGLMAERILPGNGHTTLWWVDASGFWALRERVLSGRVR